MKINVMDSMKASGSEIPSDALRERGNHLYGTKYEISPDVKTHGIAFSLCGQSLPKGMIAQTEENRIGFLNQCKLELSAEVIRWKEESLKMQKEKEVSEQKIQDLQSLVSKLTNKNTELENSLLSSLRENEKLKMHSLAVDEENFVLHKKLSKTFSKYHSYPWSDMLNKSLQIPYNDSVYQPAKINTQESWEEVSQKLLSQMKQEMKELQELGQKLTMEDHSLEPSTSVIADKEGNCDLEDSLIDNMCTLKTEMKYLRQQLEKQKEKLETLTNTSSQDADMPLEIYDDTNEQYITLTSQETDQLDINEGENYELTEKQFVRPSDESFRAYFTRQLGNSKSAEELRRMMEFYLQGDEDEYSEKKHEKVNHGKLGSNVCSSTSERPIKKCLPVDPNHSTQNVDTNLALQNQTLNKESQERVQVKSSSSEEERVCPICEAVFPKVISQKDFESHVVAHLEAECASILDQYEIL